MLQQGEVVNNRYRIARTIAQGGYGVVYRAWDMNLNCPCALKENLETSIPAQAQFEQEAVFLSRLRHPNLPRVSDYFFISGRGQYLVMDFVEGEDLQTRLLKANAPLPESEVMPWVLQVCDALLYMHSQSPPIIHRDIKPANIRITPEGNAMLVDFGVSKAFDPGRRTAAVARAVSSGFSPYEQDSYGLTDARSDVYALAATAYALLTGEEPCGSLARKMGTATLKEPRALNPSISPAVETALLEAMAIEPEDRVQSVSEFRHLLTQQPVDLQTMPDTVTVPHIGASPIATLPAQPFDASQPQPVEKSHRTGYIIAAIAAAGLLLLALLGGFVVLTQFDLFPSIVTQGRTPTVALAVSASPASVISATAERPQFSMTLIPAASGTPDPSSNFAYLSSLVYEDSEDVLTPGYYLDRARGRNDQAIILSLGWCATTVEILNDNWTKMAYRLTIDGREIDLATQAYLNSWDGSIGPCYGRNMLVSNWSSGEHSIIWTHIIMEDLNDGQDAYRAGDYIMETLLSIP
ncbi:MAG: serine/threonine protein kinase [Anaerolineae bacterium]|nr:serine/threonine protein kinase [Anaerolineae bacterium]